MYLPIDSLKIVVSPIDKKNYEIHLDFITEPPKTHLQEGLVVVGIEGCSVALRRSFQHQVRGILPGNGEALVEVRVVNVVGCLATKGLAIFDRYKEKDYYDIYAEVSSFKNKPIDVIKEFQNHVKDPIIENAIEIIREKFSSDRSGGSFSIARLLHPTEN